MSTSHPENPMIVFRSGIGSQKPNTVRTRGGAVASACPFCDRSLLPPVIREDGDIMLVPNKYPILQDTDPYVLIETSVCDAELATYDEDQLLRVFRLAFAFWRDMLANPAYRSVLFMKNHGPFSGGSLRHPHLQLIGFYEVDVQAHIRLENFLGPIILEEPGVQLTLSDHPLVGFTEFNAILTEEGAFPDFCGLIQQAVRYTLRYAYEGNIDSYNLFFYQLDGATYCKIMPRGATTPIYIGYGIPQVADDLGAIAADFRQRSPM